VTCCEMCFFLKCAACIASNTRLTAEVKTRRQDGIDENTRGIKLNMACSRWLPTAPSLPPGGGTSLDGIKHRKMNK